MTDSGIVSGSAEARKLVLHKSTVHNRHDKALIAHEGVRRLVPGMSAALPRAAVTSSPQMNCILEQTKLF